MSDFIISEQLKALPKKPGVYLMKDSRNKIIYVGKAVSLKSRVSSYFSNTSKTPKTKELVSKIKSFEYIIANSERDAFIIECNLIKSYLPKYNILLKDGKAYPYIKITLNEEYPKIQITRKVLKDGNKYFGPFPHGTRMYDVINLIQTSFPIRNCEKTNFTKKTRPCLNYHIKRCLGPCTCDDVKEDYNKNVKELVDFLEGNNKKLLNNYKLEMENASKKMEFEKAARFRDRIFTLRKISDVYMIKPNTKDIDVICALVSNGFGLCVILKVRDGSIVAKKEYKFNDIEFDENELCVEFIRQYYMDPVNIPKEILVYNDLEDFEGIKKWLSDCRKSIVDIRKPQKGSKKLLALTGYNTCKGSLDIEALKQNANYNNLVELAKRLHLEVVPELIESYDISNFSGSDTVGSMIVFEKGKAKRSAYRKFEIKDNKKSDDLHAMKEMLTRRIKRLKDKKFADIPNLILIDGGKNQTNAILSIMEEYSLDIPVCGMVKDDKHITRALVFNDLEIDIKDNMNLFRFISAIQNETHRVAIEFNRKKRNKRYFTSELNKIEGIGEQRKNILMKEFGSIREIKASGIEQLQNVKGISLASATTIYKYFHGE